MVSVVAPAAEASLAAVAPVVYVRGPYHPTAADVAAVLRTRTRDNAGNEVGAFTANTRPTHLQVQELIEGSVQAVRIRLTDEIPTRLHGAAKHAATLYTAAAIERSYYPEQSADRDNSAYALFKQDFEELMTHLVESVVDPAAGNKGVYSVQMTSTTTGQPPWWDYPELM